MPDITHPAPEPDEEDRSRIELGPAAWVRADDLRFQFSRSGGPGGQSVNKLNTRAELRVDAASIQGLDDAARDRLRTIAGSRLTGGDEIVITCDEHRSQHANRREAINRLAELVAEATRKPKVRKKRRPSRAAIERRLERKRKQAEKKDRRQWRAGD